MERAEGGLKPLTVKALLTAYGITEPREIDAFLALARDATKPGWWHSYDDVLPAWFRTFIGLEEAASSSAATTRTGYPACCRPRTTPAPACGPASPTPPTVKPSGGWPCGWPASTS